MTKLIITLLVVGLLGVAAPQIYYHYNQVPIVVSTTRTFSKPEIVHKTVTKKVINRKIVVIPTVTPETKEYIDDAFGKDSKVATATLMHESGLVLDKKGYNCHYYNKEGKRYSTSCKTVADRANAWSVDCGIAQINVKGKVCPARLLTLEGNMEAAKKIYKEQGLNAWVSYTSGAYKKFLSS